MRKEQEEAAMKSKMRKKLIAFLLCMVLVICNSVSILADTPAEATTTVEKQTKETGAVKETGSEAEKKEIKAGDADDTKGSPDSDSPEESKTTQKKDESGAPETKTTEEKEDTTKATTEAKEDSDKSDEETTEEKKDSDKVDEVTTEAREDSDKTSEATTATETTEKDDTDAAGEEDKEKTTTEAASSETTTETEKATEETKESVDTNKSTEHSETTAASELKYEDENVTITVSANEENAIPAGAALKVVPILKNDKETKAQYKEVEEQILTKVLEDNKEIAGFLAYDITFVDQNNNELEPTGEVQVSMEYKNSVMPEKITETKTTDTTVKVMHLEEDANGQVEKVVDMSTNNQVRSVQTTETQAVEKAEFVTDSFSVFTITWIDNTSAALTAYCVDDDGNPIEIDNNGHLEETTNGEAIIRNISINKEILVNQLSTMLDSINGDEYIFSKAFIGSNWENRQQIQRIRYSNSNNSWQYNIQYEGGKWVNIGGYNKLYLQYDNNRPTNVPKKDTVDSVADGIEINLFNYNANINTGAAANAGFGFYANGYELDVNDSNKGNFTGDYTNANESPQKIHQDYLKNNLNEDGYPVLKGGEADLGYLFGDGTNNGVTGVYEGLNGLFQKDDNGYYYYDSSIYHAQLNTQQWKLDVYDARLSPDTATFNYGNFLPFNQLPSDAVRGGLYSVNGGRNATDLWFGMNINMTFYQPKEGKINDEDMVFDFRGDDDVWVFIDGVKVLDIGGIHDKKEGSINFASGKVTVEGKAATTIAELYGDAYRELNPGVSQSDVNQYLNNIFNKDASGNYTSFKNFSSHEMKFFYLERGAGASNCKIEFNMAVLPKDSITIGKEISNYDSGAYNDVAFEFEVYQGSGDKKEDYTKVTSGNYTLVKADDTRETLSIDSSGIITLRHGERAIINELQQGTNYYVKEIGLSSNTYDEVIIESAGIEDENHIDISDTDVESQILTVGEDYYVNFRNQCAATNMKYLVIKKTLEDSSDSSQDESFAFKVTVGGGLYKGNYKIGNSYDAAVASPTQMSTDNGTITLKAGEVAVILGNATLGTETGIPSGTSFKVEEINLNEDIYRIPSYTMKEQDEEGKSLIDNPVISDDTYDGYAAGDITLNGNAEVNVTNAYNTEEDNQPYITVSKTFKGLSWKQIQSLKDGFSLTVKDSSSEVVDTLTLDGHGSTIAPYNISPSDGENNEDEVRDYTFTWKVTECSTGTYTVEENGETLNGYDVSTSGEGTVDVSELTWSFSSDVKLITDNASSNITLGTQSIVAASLKGKQYLIWTSMSLSSAQKEEVIRWLNSDEDGDLTTFRTGANSVTLENSHFYSGDGLKDGITFSGSTIKFVPSEDGSQTGTLTFGDKSVWQHVLSGDYIWQEQKNGDIDVTNTYSKQYTIKVDKTWAYPEEFSLDSTTTEHSEVMVALYDGDTIAENANGEKLVQTTDNGTCTFTNLPENTYTVREVVKSGDQYIPIESGGYVKLGEDDKVNSVTGNIYSVSYDEKTTGLPAGVDKYYTVTNTLVLGSVEIIKTDAENKPLAGAEFTITGPNNYSNVLTTELKDTEDDEKIATVKFTNLLPGEYTITETKSPEGYSLLANPIKIKIGAGQDELITNGILNQDKGYEAVASSTGDKSTYYYNWGATVVNNKLFTMPEAGGRNIFMLTLAGTAMIALAAGSTIYYRRRRGAHNKVGR